MRNILTALLSVIAPIWSRQRRSAARLHQLNFEREWVWSINPRQQLAIEHDAIHGGALTF